MKISIITVSFNASATIEHCLNSVADQVYPDIEHIVIDGGSTDGTQDCVVRHASRLAHFVSEPDLGIYDAMNKGIRLASGDLVGMLNADDVYAHRNVLANVAKIMEREQLEVLYGDVAFFRSDRPDVTVRRYRSNRFSPTHLAWGWMPAHPSLFLRRQIYQRFGLFRTDFRIAGDYELIARIFKDPSIRYRYLAEVLVLMRTGGVSTDGWRNTLLLNSEVLRACRDNGIRTNLFMILSKYPLKALEYLLK